MIAAEIDAIAKSMTNRIGSFRAWRMENSGLIKPNVKTPNTAQYNAMKIYPMAFCGSDGVAEYAEHR